MQRRLNILVLAVLVMGTASAAWAESAADLLENGLYTEQTVGDLVAAVRIYQKVLTDPQATKAQKAQAQFRLGMCYMKQRQSAAARAAFLAVVEKYADQKLLVAGAKLRLGRLLSPNPAALMPPETLFYVEMGSPGQQVEKLVKMLRGTPLANPLAIIGRGRRPASAPARTRRRAKTPADIISALMNPSMLAEFKKVRGLAVGVSGVSGSHHPPFVAVLYPGESDALRGILTAGLLMLGQQGEPIEGMQTVVMDDLHGAVCAYDDAVMILASTKEQLTWSVKQYKGTSKAPSLATANQSFAKLTSAEGRRKDALTVWADPAAIFAALRKQFGPRPRRRRGGMPAWLLAADALADFRNIDGAVARMIIHERNPYLEAQVSFKEGHKCLLYDLVRTPRLTRAGFAAVPSEAVGIMSFALGEAQRGEEAAQAARKAVRRFTGLDIGREIFANIEQVSLFALPPSPEDAKNRFAKMTSPVVLCVGLVITSRDPQRTRQFLDRLFSLPELIASVRNPGQAAPAEDVPGRYLLFSARGENVYCYVAQTGRSTVLALKPRVTAAAVAAAKSGRNAFEAGLLQASLSKLPGGTTKLIVVNAGGAVKLVLAHATGSLPPAARTRPSVQRRTAMFARLAEALAKTNVQLHTVEAPNGLTVRLSVSDLPPLGELFGLVMPAH